MADNDCQNGCTDERIRRIYEYLDGALTKEDLEEIHAHLTDCSECEREYNLECVIRTVIKRSCTETAPAQLKQSILTRIEAQCSDHPAA
ncbi:mycothiol system anti-sigma-R factor [Kocuria carniphila]|uniref:mycothiol system anti-sigma-R factor n=1 Tax=Kocuria carniphila TaxID=262208 RepID=UPI00101D74B1|nr:mycothiol system anti-sigma-R factor [Kocuria carniphila]MCT1802645.1 mycothiol system anti-sigma-R factor [Kocuria carniphila]